MLVAVIADDPLEEVNQAPGRAKDKARGQRSGAVSSPKAGRDKRKITFWRKKKKASTYSYSCSIRGTDPWLDLVKVDWLRLSSGRPNRIAV